MYVRWLRDHIGWLKAMLFLVGLCPLAWLTTRWTADTLGPNPLETLTTITGLTSLYFLWITLLITPARRWLSLLAQHLRWQFGKRIGDWNFLVRLRRQLGLWSFFYAVVHTVIFLEFDSGWDLASVLTSIAQKPYLALGSLALLLLLPLAATSPTVLLRKLGRVWLTIHRLVYLIAVLVLLHYGLQAKSGAMQWLPEAMSLFVLLGYRLAVAQGWVGRWQGQNGLEVLEREPSQNVAPQAASGEGQACAETAPCGDWGASDPGRG